MAGFTDIQCETVALSSRVSARDAAQGLVLGSPFRSEIERRDPSALDRAVNAVTEALRPWDGKDAPISAHVVTATKQTRHVPGTAVAGLPGRSTGRGTSESVPNLSP